VGKAQFSKFGRKSRHVAKSTFSPHGGEGNFEQLATFKSTLATLATSGDLLCLL